MRCRLQRKLVTPNSNLLRCSAQADYILDMLFRHLSTYNTESDIISIFTEVDLISVDARSLNGNERRKDFRDK